MIYTYTFSIGIGYNKAAYYNIKQVCMLKLDRLSVRLK